MLRGKLVLIQQSRQLTARYGAVLGAFTGLVGSGGAVVIAPRYSNGAAAVLLSTDIGVVALALFAASCGAVTGSLLGSAQASFVSVTADAVSARRASLYVLFGVVAAPLLFMNTLLMMLACVVLLGYSDTSSWEIAPLAFVAGVTVGAVSVYVWAQSLDWPARITPPDKSYGEIDLTASTKEHGDLHRSLRRRLEDVN